MYLFADYWDTQNRDFALCLLVKSLNKLGDHVNTLKPQKEKRKNKDLGWGWGKWLRYTRKDLLTTPKAIKNPLFVTGAMRIEFLKKPKAPQNRSVRPGKSFWPVKDVRWPPEQFNIIFPFDLGWVLTFESISSTKVESSNIFCNKKKKVESSK